MYIIVIKCPVANKWLIFIKDDISTKPFFFTNIRLAKASGLSLQSLNKVYNMCLNPILELTLVNMLSSGFNI